MGLIRVILSRELSLDEIGEIRQQVPDMELEILPMATVLTIRMEKSAPDADKAANLEEDHRPSCRPTLE